MVRSTYGNAGFLFHTAREAYQKAQLNGHGAQIIESPNSLVAVVFSALATEAFVNEIPEFAEQSTDQSDWVKNLAALGKKVEESNGQITLKVAVMFIVLTGQTYDASRQPFQDFETLVRLRNELAHIKPVDIFERDTNGVITNSPRRILSRLPAHILATPPREDNEDNVGQNVPLPLTGYVSTPAAAKWACNTLAHLVEAIVASMPSSQFKATMESYSSQFFQPLT